MTTFRLAAVAAALLLPACASFGTFADADGEPQYGSDADSNLASGEEAMTSENYDEAARYFEYVKTKFPYLEASRTAELRLADCDFQRERYAEARERYFNFVRLHPDHPRVDYAAFRAALTHFKGIPSDFFLLPPASEKDQVEVRNALSAMGDFLRANPKSEHAAEATDVIARVKRRLAEHELYVAEFYARRGKWAAVAGRLEGMAARYEGLGYDETTYLGLHQAYLGLQDGARARAALERYLEKYPEQPGAKKARALLAAMPPAAPPPAGSPPPMSSAPEVGTPDAGTPEPADAVLR